MNDTDADDVMQQGMRLAQAGNLAAAGSLFGEILQKMPDHPGALEGAGLIALEQGEAETARGYLRRALQSAGPRADLSYNLANAEAAAGNFAAAAEGYRQAVELAPDFIEAWFNLGEVLEGLDRLDDSVGAYERVIELDPALAPAHGNLGNVLTEAGRLDEAIDAFGRAIDLAPEFPPTHTNLGNALKYAGRLNDAITAHREALRLAPDYADARYNLGAALFLAGDYEEAEEALSLALAIRPELSRARLALGATKIGLNRAEEAVALCEAALAEDCEMLALRPFALAAAGRSREAHQLADYDRMIVSSRLAPPAGYNSLPDFNSALVDHILAHPSLAHAPTSHATVNGQHTGNLLTEPKGPFAALEELLWTEVRRYQSNLTGDEALPYSVERPLGELVVWSIVMASDGHQVAHIHPTGWISGVYYPQLPEFAADEYGAKAGWIEFGAPPPEIPYTGDMPLKTIRPEEGLLLLFPSFFYHRTIPFDAVAPRVSIAFDFRPAG